NSNRFSQEVLMLAQTAPPPLRWIVAVASAITSVDYTPARVICDVHRQLPTQGIGLALARVDADLKPVLDRYQLSQTMRASHVFESLHDALGALRARDAA